MLGVVHMRDACLWNGFVLMELCVTRGLVPAVGEVEGAVPAQDTASLA